MHGVGPWLVQVQTVKYFSQRTHFESRCSDLKVHQRETFVGSDLEFCNFLDSICLNIKV